MKYSILITSNRPAEKIIPLLKSIQKQTVMPEQIFLVCDYKFTNKTFENYKKNIGNICIKNVIFITNLKGNFIPGSGVSYNRNYGMVLVKTPLILSIDDDNVIEKDFCERLIIITKNYKKINKSDAIFIPTEYYKGKVRSRGYTKFRYRLGAQKALKGGKNILRKKINIGREELCSIDFSSSNCFFGPTKIFRKIPFDERMKFVYEDFDCTKRITHAGYHIFIVLSLAIDHHMRKKTKLEESYLSDEAGFGIYEKSKNRVLFVKNTGNIGQKIIFFILGLWIHSVFLIIKILKYADKSRRKILFSQLVKGTWKGIVG